MYIPSPAIPTHSSLMAGRGNPATQEVPLQRATLGREALRKACPSPQRRQKTKVTCQKELMGSKGTQCSPLLCPTPWGLIASIPGGLCHRAVPPRAAFLGLSSLRETLRLLLPPTSPFAKVMTTESLKLNVGLTQSNQKYWNWPRATGLPRVGGGDAHQRKPLSDLFCS